MMNSQRGNKGFSLMELLIVVAIIAILAAFAVPSYRSYVLTGHRTNATKALQDLASREESYFFSNNVYPATLASVGYTSATLPSNDYQVSIASASSTDYKVTATPIGAQAQDGKCTSFSLNHAGQQQSTGTASSTTCWGSSQ